MPMVSDAEDGCGLTISEVLTKGLFGLAREYLIPTDRIQQHDTPSTAHQSGMQIELFTPGDVGVTMRYRW
jgi:hypothetical protein